MSAASPYAPPAAPWGGPSYRPLGWKTTAAAVAIFLTLPAHLAASGSLLLGEQAAESPAGALVLIGAGMAALGSSLVAAIAFLVWLHQAATNVRAFGHSSLQFTPGWCVGWWFVPFANLVKPFRAVKEVWKASDPDSVGTGYDDTWITQPVASLLPAWWAAWIISGVLDRISGKIESAQAAGVFGLLGVLASAVGAFLVVAIMREIARRQEAAWAKLEQLRAAREAVHGWGYRQVVAA